jgi:hypothetical protein
VLLHGIGSNARSCVTLMQTFDKNHPIVAWMRQAVATRSRSPIDGRGVSTALRFGAGCWSRRTLVKPVIGSLGMQT